MRPADQALTPKWSKQPSTTVKVVHLDHSSEPGGAELALARLLKYSTHPATLILPRDSRGSAFASIDNKRIKHVGPPQRPGATTAGIFGTIYAIAGIARMAASLRASKEFRSATVVHANTSRAAVYGALATLGTRKRLVVHIRDMVARDALGTAGYLGLRHLALKRADSVIANSEATLETAMPYLSPKAKRHVIPSPLGLDEYSGRPAVAHIPLSIGMIARLDTWKGQDLLIRAFKRAGLSGKANLYFIGGASFGKESYATSLRELSSDLGVAEDVNFVGHVEDIRPMLESLDICVQASTRPEPLGQNVLQYLAAGKAVIAADAGGPREWIRSGVNGLLFDLGNERRLAQHLQLLVTDAGLRERLAHQAAKTPGIRTDREVAMAHANVFAGRDQV